ncbi:phosphoribosylanthranilate isomerase [Acidiferrobacter sp.]|jgi:phosphoribosylanthranilate isomerase|uniref:phosphoribosylanthranilate isomerase n=1 Tax=Acidiferrobacter sp. TaxID=1872107 RepID=UPI002633020B|nr:phosphoribosylanthranilate isomerase [Acidiferrobacter sp.]
MPTRVKICGITRPTDAAAAAAAGADAIGLVFYRPSPRHVDIDTARAILDAVPPFVTRVGLFVDAAADEIEAVLASVALDVLQFHGRETPEECRRYGRPYLKAISMGEGVDVRAAEAHYASAQGLLLDTHQKGRPGGTGQIFDWGRIPAGLGKPVILAGGLSVANVAAAIDQVRPYAVDVSGGVESAPGIKDERRMREFCRHVRGES